MELSYIELKDDVESLVEFLTSDTWAFHAVPHPKPERIRENFKDQGYTGDNNKTFWVISDESIKVGLIRIYDLEDGIPLLDIRILSKYRGMGIGTMVIKWVTKYVFETYADKDKLESYTRQDNYAMRCVFHKCGYVKEAQHRNTWKDNITGKMYDAIGYGITREDWESGKVTPVDWNDFKC